MRTLFVLCTVVTVFQIFNVSITGVSASPVAKPSNRTAKETPKIAPRTVIKPSAPSKVPEPADKEPGKNPDDDDSVEGEPPKTFKESSQRAKKTLKKVASRRGAGIMNGFSGILKKTDGAFNIFGKFIQDRSNNVKDVAKESLGMVSNFSDSSSRGAIHFLKSGSVIGQQAGKEMFNTLQKATKLGKNIAKLGGTTVSTPLSIGEDVVGTANKVAKIPSKISRTVTNGAIKPALGYIGLGSDEEDEKEDEKEAEEKDEGEQTPKNANKTPQSPRKPAVKK